MRTEGTLLDGKYRLIRRIASGGMGEVWQGRIEYPDGYWRPCAIKFMRPGVTTPEDGAAALMREAVLGFEVSENHPNLITTRDYCDSPDGRFVVTELVEGPTLWDVSPQLRGRYDLLYLITQRAVFALAEMHRHGVVHYDVSPANILLDRTGAVKLGDYGMSGHIVSPHRGTLRGVAAYMSPEEMDMGQGTPASDLYSLGGVIYTLITDQPPYGKGSIQEIRDRMADPQTPLPAETPADLARIVDGLLELDPLRRMTALEVLGIVRDTTDPVADDADIATIARDWLARTSRQVNNDSHADTLPRPSQVAREAARLTQVTTGVGPGHLRMHFAEDPDAESDDDGSAPAKARVVEAYADTPMGPLDADADAVPDMPVGALPLPIDIFAADGKFTADEFLKRWLGARVVSPPPIESKEPTPALPMIQPPEPHPSDDAKPRPNGWYTWPIIAVLTFIIGVLVARGPGEPPQPTILAQSPEPAATVSQPTAPAPAQPSILEPERARPSTASEPAETTVPPVAVRNTPSDAQRAPAPGHEQRPDTRVMQSSDRPPTRPARRSDDESTSAQPPQLDDGLPSRIAMRKKIRILGMVARGSHDVAIDRRKCSDDRICIVAERVVQFDDGQRILRVRMHNGSKHDFHPDVVSLKASGKGANFAELAQWAMPDGTETNVIPQNRTATGAVWLQDSAWFADEVLELMVSEGPQPPGGPRDQREAGEREEVRSIAVAGIQLR